jgi:3-dehydroquinate dehydratase/shikimate dehydrogenase
MLCVTGLERAAGPLLSRVAAVASRLPGCLQEVRLDALEDPPAEVLPSLAPWIGSLILAARPVRQGGLWTGAEAGRLDLLRSAIALGPFAADVEADVDAAILRGGATATRIVRSLHDFDGFPADLAARATALEAAGADVVKVAVRVDDPADLARLLALRSPGRRVLIGMGAAGVLSRVRYRAFGSPWTYVAASSATASAPGQPSLDDAIDAGLPGSADRPFYALVGGSVVARSPGPRVYGRLFRKRGIEASYAAVATARPRETFDLLAALGAAGIAVTMPHKEAALAHGEPDAEAARVGAANTLKVDGTRFLATNTDVAGVREPLATALGTRRGRALVFGAGGAASAAIAACRDLGLDVVVAARKPVADLESVTWDRRDRAAADVIVNATPDPSWPFEAPPAAAVVFDLAMGEGPSELLSRARAAGAVVLGPHAMWVHQGAAQMTFLLGEPVSPAELSELLA